MNPTRQQKHDFTVDVCKELHDKLAPFAFRGTEQWCLDASVGADTILSALALAAAVEESQDEVVRELLNVYPKDSGYADKCRRAAARIAKLEGERDNERRLRELGWSALDCPACGSHLAGKLENYATMKSERDSLKRHAEAMAHYTECYGDKFPDSGANLILADYRRDSPKEEA